MASCIHYGHSIGINVANHSGQTWSHVVRMTAGYFYATASSAQHVALQTSATPSVDMRFTDVDFTHTASSWHVYWNAAFNSTSTTRIRLEGCKMTGGMSLFSLNGGSVAPNNISLNDVDCLNTKVTFSNATEWSVVGGIYDNSYIELDTSNTNWLIDHVHFRNNLTRFVGVTTPISIYNNATNASIEILDPVGYTGTPVVGTIRNFNPGVTFANLGTPSDGSIVYCLDGTVANPVTGGGTGCIAKRLNSAWVGN
jgi:hypothetical protein